MLRRGAVLAREHLKAAEARFPALATDVPYLRLDLASKATLTDDEVKSLGLVPVFRRDQSILVAHGTDSSLARVRGSGGLLREGEEDALYDYL